MKIEGSYQIPASRERIFQALIDPVVLEKCIPGCEKLEKTGEDHYSAKISAGVGSIKSVFSATITMQDLLAPSHYKLVVEGKGPPGFLKGSGDLDLEPKDNGTEIRYTGDVSIGGLLASVGQRMIQVTANMMAGKFFKSLEEETLKGGA